VKLEGEYEEVVGETETVTRRIKEADKVACPKFPSVTNVRAWHTQLTRNLVLASGRTDGAEVAWLNVVLDKGSTFESLSNSGEARFATLDLKLHNAVSACIKEGNKTLAVKVASREEAALESGKLLKGRQLVWLVHDWFRLNPDLKPLYGFQEIADIQWLGDENIFEFLERWTNMVRNNSIKLTDAQLATTLVEKMKPSKVLAQDIAYYHRLPDGDEQKTYEYLINSMQRYLDRTQMDKNNEGRRAFMRSGRSDTTLQAAGGSSAAGGKAGGGGGKRWCYFFNHGGCTNDKCTWLHEMAPADERAKMTRPTRGGSRSPSPDGKRKGGGKGKEKGSGGNQQQQQFKMPQYCKQFAKGNCNRPDCMYIHASQEEVDRATANAKKREAELKAKAKAEPKAKAKAAPPAPMGRAVVATARTR
jgi:hypothetical protein